MTFSTSPVVDFDRTLTSQERAALVSIEVMDRLTARALQALDQDRTEDAAQLLEQVREIAQDRMATAIKHQDLSDDIAAEAVSRVRAVLESASS